MHLARARGPRADDSHPGSGLRRLFDFTADRRPAFCRRRTSRAAALRRRRTLYRAALRSLDDFTGLLPLAALRLHGLSLLAARFGRRIDHFPGFLSARRVGRFHSVRATRALLLGANIGVVHRFGGPRLLRRHPAITEILRISHRQAIDDLRAPIELARTKLATGEVARGEIGFRDERIRLGIRL